MANQFVCDTDAEISKQKQLYLKENSAHGMDATQSDNNNNKHDDSEPKENFFDTGFHQEWRAPRKSRHIPVEKDSNDNEPLLVYSDENSSITRTVRDQFAVALLKLQSDLEATGRRLSELESAVRNAGVGRGTTRTEQGARPSTGGKCQSGNMMQILYIGWPMIVYIAMRYMERRSLANKLAQ